MMKLHFHMKFAMWIYLFTILNLMWFCFHSLANWVFDFVLTELHVYHLRLLCPFCFFFQVFFKFTLSCNIYNIVRKIKIYSITIISALIVREIKGSVLNKNLITYLTQKSLFTYNFCDFLNATESIKYGYIYFFFSFPHKVNY